MYLGSLITEDERSKKETKRSIMIARATFTNMRTLLSCRGINLKTRLRAIKCYVWPTLFYWAERWTMTKSLFQTWCLWDVDIYRRVLKIPWTEKITNEEVLRRMGTGREIVRQFKTRKLQYLGHLIRHNSITEKLNGNWTCLSITNAWCFSNLQSTLACAWTGCWTSSNTLKKWQAGSHLV